MPASSGPRENVKTNKILVLTTDGTVCVGRGIWGEGVDCDTPIR